MDRSKIPGDFSKVEQLTKTALALAEEPSGMKIAVGDKVNEKIVWKIEGILSHEQIEQLGLAIGSYLLHKALTKLALEEEKNASRIH